MPLSKARPASCHQRVKEYFDVYLLLAYTRGEAKKEAEKQSFNVYFPPFLFSSIKRTHNHSGKPTIKLPQDPGVTFQGLLF